MTAIERAQELLCETKVKDLPPLAREYAEELCRRVSGCAEVLLSAYAAYAEVVEGLEASVPDYAAHPDARQWFQERQSTQRVYVVTQQWRPEGPANAELRTDVIGTFSTREKAEQVIKDRKAKGIEWTYYDVGEAQIEERIVQ